MTTPIIKKACRRLLNSFNEITKANEKYLSNKEEFELDHNRNKALLLIHGLYFLQLLTSLIISKNELASNFQGLVGSVLICAVLIISCHLSLHPQVFKSIYNLYLLSLGVSLMTHDLIGALFVTLVSPLLVYFLTGSLLHFLIHIVCKTLLINTIYQESMQASLAYMSVDEVVKAFTHFINQNSMYFLVCILVIHYTIQKNLYGNYVAEKEIKKRNMEIPSEKITGLLMNGQSVPELHHNANNISDPEKNEIDRCLRVYDTIERSWNVCSKSIQINNLRGRMKIAKDIPRELVIDYHRVTQILLSVIRNIVKSTKSRNVDITVEWIKDLEAANDMCYDPSPLNDSNNQDFIFLDLYSTRIDRDLVQLTSTKDGILKISVDSGCEILKKDFPRLLERYTNGTVNYSSKQLETDQDLFTAQKLCQQINGGVKVLNQNDRSSSFVVCLPVTKEMLFSFYRQNIQRISMQRKLKVLVVDDIDFCLDIIKDYLGKMGIDDVETAKNGLETYEKFVDHALRKDNFGLITMGLDMPIMDGKQTARKIREYETLNNLNPCPIIIISASCCQSNIQECVDKHGTIKAHDFIKKPAMIDDVYRSILSIFEKKHQGT